jgi:hypothetical protein
MYSVRDTSVAILLVIALACSAAQRASAIGSSDTLTWQSVSPGVNFARADTGTGHDVFIGLGGYTVKQAWANNWVGKLREAKLHGLGIRYFYAVSGPADDAYYGREIGTLDLARHLIALLQSDAAVKRIIVAAHSSGAYVAHALFQDLYEGSSIDSTHLTDGKMLYFCLDGGIGANGSGVEITQTMASRLGHIYGVYAVMPSERIYSPGYEEMIALGRLFGDRSSSLLVNAAGCGCTGKWCVHETVINQKPYNHSTFDLENDYNNITVDHPVATSYLDGVTDVDETRPSEGFLLEQNYPNPFNAGTVIGYTVQPARHTESPEAGGGTGVGVVRLAVYDLLGREVAMLVNEKKAPGTYTVQFNASALASGVYVYRLTADGCVRCKSMVVLK